MCTPGASWSECGVQEAIKLNQCKGVWIEGVGEGLSLRCCQRSLEGGGIPACSNSGTGTSNPLPPLLPATLPAVAGWANDNAFDCVACQVG